MAHMVFLELISDTGTALSHLLEHPRISLTNSIFLWIASTWLIIWLLRTAHKVLRTLISRNSSPPQRQAHTVCDGNTTEVKKSDTRIRSTSSGIPPPQAPPPPQDPMADSLDNLRKAIKLVEAGMTPRSPKVKDVEDMEMVAKFLSASAQGRREHDILEAGDPKHKSHLQFDSDED